MSMTSSAPAPPPAMTATDNPEYFAGLLDAQLGVSFRAKKHVRVTLTSADRRVATELATVFQPSRVTTVQCPGKKDTCVAVYTHDAARPVLEFAAKHCVMKKSLAEATLQFLEGEASVEDVTAKVNDLYVPEDVTVPWASGFFDVRGTVTPPPPAPEEGEVTATGKKKVRRGTIKLVLPKSEKGIIPILQKVLDGKVKKSSPCRLVFESRETIRKFVDVVGDHVRVKREDLDMVLG